MGRPAAPVAHPAFKAGDELFAHDQHHADMGVAIRRDSRLGASLRRIIAGALTTGDW